MLQIAIIRMLSIYYQEFIFVFVLFFPQDVCIVMFHVCINNHASNYLALTIVALHSSACSSICTLTSPFFFVLGGFIHQHLVINL
jgi:hypothetical protein